MIKIKSYGKTLLIQEKDIKRVEYGSDGLYPEIKSKITFYDGNVIRADATADEVYCLLKSENPSDDQT